MTYSPETIAQWLRKAGGAGGGNFRYIGFDSMLRKDITSAGDTFVAGDFFTDTYGRKVWDSLNSQTRAFNLLRKTAWGPTTGWRVRTGRNRSTTAVTETGALPTIDSPDLATVRIEPKFIVTSLAASALAQFLGTLEGGIGDALAVAQETAMVDHTQRINEMLLAGNYTRIIDGATDSAPTTEVLDATWFTPGDVLHEVGGAVVQPIASVNYDTNEITFSYAGGDTGDFAANDIARVTSRGTMWSLTDAIEDPVGRVFAAGNDNTLDASTELMAYASLTIAQRQQAWARAKLEQSGSGGLRHLSTGLLDKSINNVRRAGGEPDLMITGIEQITRLGTILQANQHFIGEGTFQVKQGGEGTLVGYPTGFQVATYKGIPLFHDFDVATSIGASGSTLGGGDVLTLDTRFVELPVLFTTQYLESRDYLQNNSLTVKGIFLTALNTRVLDINKQSRITDLTTGD